MDVTVVVLYLAAMIAFGFWGKRRATTQSDFLVAGRRLGPLLYSGTMAAIVLGGASTIGGVGLGYEYGLSGMWLVVAIGTGILALSALFAGRIQRLGVYTVSQMLEVRYGPGSSVLSGVVMWGYMLMLSATSTIAPTRRSSVRCSTCRRCPRSSSAAASSSSAPRSAACGRSRSPTSSSS